MRVLQFFLIFHASHMLRYKFACSMSDSELDIYQELFAKIQENRKEIGTNSLDSFEVLFNDGDTVLETWVSFYYFKNILEYGLHI